MLRRPGPPSRPERAQDHAQDDRSRTTRKVNDMRTRKFITGVAAAALAALPLTAAAAANHTPAEIVVVHGVPGLEVDVLVNGAPAITGFSFGGVVKTSLPAGDYTFGVAATGTTSAILELEASLGAGISVTIAAYLDEDGNPQLQAFLNENSASGIQPFHLASFGAVDILSGTTTVLGPVTNGQTARIDVAGGTTVPAVGIGAAGSGTAALSLGDVTVLQNQLLLVYAIGPNTGDALPTVVTASTNVGGVRIIPSGSGGQTSTVPLLVLSLMLAGSVMAVAPRLAARSRA